MRRVITRDIAKAEDSQGRTATVGALDTMILVTVPNADGNEAEARIERALSEAPDHGHPPTAADTIDQGKPAEPKMYDGFDFTGIGPMQVAIGRTLPGHDEFYIHINAKGPDGAFAVTANGIVPLPDRAGAYVPPAAKLTVEQARDLSRTLQRRLAEPACPDPETTPAEEMDLPTRGKPVIQPLLDSLAECEACRLVAAMQGHIDDLRLIATPRWVSVPATEADKRFAAEIHAATNEGGDS